MLNWRLIICRLMSLLCDSSLLWHHHDSLIRILLVVAAAIVAIRLLSESESGIGLLEELLGFRVQKHRRCLVMVMISSGICGISGHLTTSFAVCSLDVVEH